MQFMRLFEKRGKVESKLTNEVESLKGEIVKITNLHRDILNLEQIADTDLFIKNAANGTPEDLHRLFKGIVEVSIPILYIARSIAKLPIHEFNIKTGKLIENSEVIFRLNNPNQYQKSRFEFIKSMIINNQVSDCYINKIGAPGLVPEKLFLLDPTTTIAIFSKESDIRFSKILRYETRFTNSQSAIKIDAEDVYHMTDEASTYDEVKNGGVSTVRYLARVLQSLEQNYKSSDEIARGRKTLVSEKNNANNPSFSGQIINQTGSDDAKVHNPGRDIENKLYRNYGHGNTSRGNIAYLAKEVAVQQLGFSPEQLGLRNFKEDYFLKSCMVAGVDPLLVGFPGASTYNNKIEAGKQFWEQTGQQMAMNIASALSIVFGLKDTELRFDFSNIEALKQNRKETFEMSIEAYDRQLATGNELREAAGMGADNQFDNLKNSDNDK